MQRDLYTDLGRLHRETGEALAEMAEMRDWQRRREHGCAVCGCLPGVRYRLGSKGASVHLLTCGPCWQEIVAAVGYYIAERAANSHETLEVRTESLRDVA